MLVQEKSAEGLSRAFTVTVPASELQEKLTRRIAEIQPQVRLKGFRPGKVPPTHIRKMFGRSMMGEILEDLLKGAGSDVLAEKELRAASTPELDLPEDMEPVLAGDADLAFDVRVEVMPDFEPIDASTLALERPVAEIDDAEVDEALAQIAENSKSFVAREPGEVSVEGDQVVIDFLGKKDGEAFEGGASEDAEVVIGAKRFIPGFEEGLTGLAQGAETVLEITMPADYHAADLAGAVVTFDVKVKEVRRPELPTVDDAFATEMGFQDLEALRGAIRDNLARQYAGQSRLRVKRRLLDALDAAHAFELPPGMLDAEFKQIWSQIEADQKAGRLDEEDAAKSEDDLRADYQKIAERRVRLGLVLAEIGQRANIGVTAEELARAINTEARRYPGQEKEYARFLQSDAGAQAALRAPIFEEKVVDHILSLANVTDVPISKDALFEEET